MASALAGHAEEHHQRIPHDTGHRQLVRVHPACIEVLAGTGEVEDNKIAAHFRYGGVEANGGVGKKCLDGVDDGLSYSYDSHFLARRGSRFAILRL